MSASIIVVRDERGKRLYRKACEFCGKTFTKDKRHLILARRYCNNVCSAHGRNPTLEARFWDKVKRNGTIPAHKPELGPCWEWTACRNAKGYGSFGIGHVVFLAHRVAWKLQTERWPTECICHRCDNPACVRSDHLFEGTVADNTADMIAKGRDNKARGERQHLARLTDALVRTIRARHAAGESGYSISRALAIPPTTVKNVLCGRTWKHVK